MQVKFTLDAAKASKDFTPLFAAVNHSAVLPILEDVLIQNNGVLSFVSTDLENVFRIEQESAGKNKFAVCLNAKKLKQLINNAIDPAISFSGDEKKIKIKNGEFGLSSALEDAGNFPKEPVMDKKETVSFTVDTKEIIPQLEKAILFVSNDDLRPSMTGVLIKDWKGKLYAVATDAHRMYWGDICKTPEGFNGVEFIVPAKAIRLIIMAFKKDKQVAISKSNYHFRVSSDGKSLMSRLIDARYPDFSAVIPQDNKLTFNLNRKQLTSFLKICTPFTNKSTGMLKIEVSKEKILCTGGDVDFNDEFNYSLPLYNANVEFDSFKFAINTKFLIQALSVVKDEYVMVAHSTSATKAIIIDDCILIMPLMINE